MPKEIINNTLCDEWGFKGLLLNNFINIFVSTPICFIGLILCLTSVYILSREEFKEKFFVYLKIECVLMAVNLFIKPFDNLSSLYFCSCDYCPFWSRVFTDVSFAYFCTFLSSPIEATALVSDIFAAMSCLLMITQCRCKFATFLNNLNPYIAILVTFMLFSILFSYQIFTSVYTFHSDFITLNVVYFDLITFSIRDGFCLAVLLLLNCYIGWKVKSSFRKKMDLVDISAQEKTKRSRHKMTFMVLADCANSMIGRIPILFSFIIRNVNKDLNYLDVLITICCIAVYISYLLKFFIFLKFNRRFRDVALKIFPSIRFNSHIIKNSL